MCQVNDEHLASEGLIANVFDSKTTRNIMWTEGLDVKDLSEKSWKVPQIMKLLGPHWKDHWGSYFPYSRFLRPDDDLI